MTSLHFWFSDMWSWLADRKVRRVSLCRFAWFSIGIIFGYQKRVRVFDHLVATFVWPRVLGLW